MTKSFETEFARAAGRVIARTLPSLVPEILRHMRMTPRERRLEYMRDQMRRRRAAARVGVAP